MAAATLAPGAHLDLPVGTNTLKVEIEYTLKTPLVGDQHGPNIWVVPYDCDGEEHGECRFYTSAVQSSWLNRDWKFKKFEDGRKGGVLEMTVTEAAQVTYFYITNKETLDIVGEVRTRIFDVNGVPDTVGSTLTTGAELDKAGSLVMLALYMKHPPMYHGMAQRLSFHAANKTGREWIGWNVIRALYKETKTTYPSAFPPGYEKVKTGTEEASKKLAETQQHMLHGDRATVGISWDRGTTGLDLDLSAILYGPYLTVHEVVYYNKLVDSQNVARHSGDSRVGQSDFRYGAGNGDDEQISVDLQKLRELGAEHTTALEVRFVVTAHNGAITNDTNLVVTVVEGDNGVGKERIRWKIGGINHFCKGILLLTIRTNMLRGGDMGYMYVEESLLGVDIPKNGINAAVAYNLFPNFLSQWPRGRLNSVPEAFPIGDDVFRSDYMAKAPVFPPVARPAVGPRPADLPPQPALVSTQPVDVTQQQTLYVRAHLAKHLLAADWTGTSDPYIEASLASAGPKGAKVRTAVIKGTVFPVWDEDFTVNGPFTAGDSLKMDIFDKDLIGQDFIGTVSVPLADIWRMKGPQFLPVGGVDKKGRPAEGVLLVSLDWAPIDPSGAHPKFNP